MQKMRQEDYYMRSQQVASTLVSIYFGGSPRLGHAIKANCIKFIFFICICLCYIPLSDQISLSNYLYFLRY